MMKAFVGFSTIVALSGCGTTSTYRDFSSKDGNRVEATGRAAIAAGAAHSSYNCINCGDPGGGQQHPYQGNPYHGSPQSMVDDDRGLLGSSAERIIESASSAASSAISSSIYQSIYRGF